MSETLTGGKKLTYKPESELLPLLDSHIPVILLYVDEEERFLKNEEQILTRRNRVDRIYFWDFNGRLVDRKTLAATDIQNPQDVIRWFAQPHVKPDPATPEDKVDLRVAGPVPKSTLVMFDVMWHLRDDQDTGYSNPGLTRTIKDVRHDLLEHQRTLVLAGHREFVPPELEHHVTSLKYPLPDRDYFVWLVRRSCAWFGDPAKKGDQSTWLQLSDEEEVALATLLLGFRGWEAESILARACNENRLKRIENPLLPMGFDLELIRNAKVETIRSNPALNIVIPHSATIGRGTEMIGGAGSLKRWFDDRKQLFLEEARWEGIDLPKGAIMFGTGGTGKDWAVEHLAQNIGWTTLYADLGAAKGKWQGESHKAFRGIVAAAELQSPCFLVLSEWEKMMSGAMGHGHGVDDPVSSEIFATFLNWMQRRTAPVFVWALTNDMTNVPQAALRAGRWDKLWFMDLPEPWEREEIFAIHLRRTGWDPDQYGLKVQDFALRTDGYTGAEIRAVVNEAITIKYIRDGTRTKGACLHGEHVLEAIPLISPSIKMKEAEMNALKKYAEDGNIQSANSQQPGSSNQKSIRPLKIGASLADEL